jgi:hypothetical protein
MQGGAKMAHDKGQHSKPQNKVPSEADLRGEIRQRAEEIYNKRGGSPGDELSDWLAAEKEVKRKYGLK